MFTRFMKWDILVTLVLPFAWEWREQATESWLVPPIFADVMIFGLDAALYSCDAGIGSDNTRPILFEMDNKL